MSINSAISGGTTVRDGMTSGVSKRKKKGTQEYNGLIRYFEGGNQ